MRDNRGANVLVKNNFFMGSMSGSIPCKMDFLIDGIDACCYQGVLTAVAPLVLLPTILAVSDSLISQK